MARARTQIDDLESQLADLRERLTTLEAAVEAIPGGGATPPARSLRRATARRASRRRHEARALQVDTRALVVDWVASHPGSTAGEIAKGLDLNRSTVSGRIAQLVKLGQLRKVERGYAPAE